MLKRIVLLGIAGVFLAAPPAIAQSSATVQSPAPENVKGHDGPCPFDGASFEF